MMCQFDSKIFNVRPVSAVRPSSVTENLKGRYYIISGNELFKSFKWSVTGDGVTAENGLTIKKFAHLLPCIYSC